jgi:hypothetical protein
VLECGSDRCGLRGTEEFAGEVLGRIGGRLVFGRFSSFFPDGKPSADFIGGILGIGTLACPSARREPLTASAASYSELNRH